MLPYNWLQQFDTYSLNIHKIYKLACSSNKIKTFVRSFYVVAAILRNALTCMQPNNTSKFFEFEPPTVEEYFS